MSTWRRAACWDTEAATFDDEPDHGLRGAGTRAAWRGLLRGLLPAAPARILDLGCGTGSLSVLLAEEGYQVIGLDFSAAMIERAAAKAWRRPGGASFVRCDAAAPAVAPATADVVLARHIVWAAPAPAWADG